MITLKKKPGLFLFVAALNLHLLFNFTAHGQVITTIVGTGLSSYSGDGGPASDAGVFGSGLAFDAAGNLYIADGSNSVIRRVSVTDTISTFAGTGTSGYSGDGGPATAAELNTPTGITFDTAGNLFFTDFFNNRVRKISTSGIITTVAGTGVSGYAGDGGPATDAKFSSPSGICFDHFGNLYFTDGSLEGVRKVTPAGIISTYAGSGTPGFAGDGGSATAALFHSPEGIAIDHRGNIYVCDAYNYSIRKITPSGIISTFAGHDTYGTTVNGILATTAALGVLAGVVVDEYDNVFFSDISNSLVDMVSKDGILHIVAGNEAQGFSGDGGPATAAELYLPYIITLDSCGNIYIPDGGNFRVRKITWPHCGYLSTPEVQAPTSAIATYPNPVTDELHICNVYGAADFKIVNFVGEVIVAGRLTERDNTLSLRQLTTGLYLLEIVQENGKRVVSKILKE